MSKSPKTSKSAPKPRHAQPARARKPAKTARRTATSGQVRAQSRHRSNGAHRNAEAAVRHDTKQAMLVELLGGAKGASISEMAAKVGWQHHSVRGFLSGTVQKKLGLSLASETVEGRGRVYRIGKGS